MPEHNASSDLDSRVLRAAVKHIGTPVSFFCSNPASVSRFVALAFVSSPSVKGLQIEGTLAGFETAMLFSSPLAAL